MTQIRRPAMLLRNPPVLNSVAFYIGYITRNPDTLSRPQRGIDRDAFTIFDTPKIMSEWQNRVNANAQDCDLRGNQLFPFVLCNDHTVFCDLTHDHP